MHNPDKPLPRRYYNHIIAVVSLLTLTLCCEAALRVMSNPTHYYAEWGSAPLMIRHNHPQIGWFLAPNQTISWPVNRQVIRINSHGMRDRERIMKSESTRTILLGDSMLRAFEVAYTDTFYNRLENMAGRQFLNFGQSGHGTTQAYTMYEYLAKEFSADSVVYFFYLNDFSDNNSVLRALAYSAGRNRTPTTFSPQIRLEGDGDNTAVLEPALYDNPTRGNRIWKHATSNFYVVRALEYFFTRTDQRMSPPTTPDPSSDALISLKSQNNELALITDECCRTDIALAVRQLETSLRWLAAATKRDGRKLLVVNIPSPIDYLSPDELTKYRRFEILDAKTTTLVREQLKTTLNNLDVPFLDAIPFFKKTLSERELNAPYFIFPSDHHLNSTGHETLFRFLQNNLVPLLND